MTRLANETSQVRYRTLRWLLAPVIAAHNFEEWLTFPIFGETAASTAARFGVHFEAPPWKAVQLALLLVTLGPALVVLCASTGRTRLWKDFAVLWVAGIFLANVFMPHVPAAILAGGYAPGVVTAVAINLPFCIVLFHSAIAAHAVSGPQAMLAAALGAVTLPFALFGVLGFSKVIVGANL